MIIPPLGSLAGEPGPLGSFTGEPGPQDYPWGASQESLARKITPGESRRRAWPARLPLGSLAGEPGPQDYPWGVLQESLARKITPRNEAEVQIWSESLALQDLYKAAWK